MGEYLRFNRHEVFNADDRELVLDIITKVEPFSMEANQLYGLFDGYLYVDLPDNILNNCGSKLKSSIFIVEGLNLLTVFPLT